LVRLRKLLIKLVAIETALVGWLSYWLFLVYVNNPPVAAELSSSLQRFPQLSFSTIDIAVMVIIAALAVTLAFRFQRGLRPGIRLERALQMLENLMKRNLVLEAQVAELKIEKSHPPPLITSVPTPPVSTTEPRPGSWEKAFRTPLEAGPPISSKTSASNDDTPFSKETGIPPPRIEPKPQPSSSLIAPPIMINIKDTPVSTPLPTITPEKPSDKTSYANPPNVSSAGWEDSPQLIGESKGILTPSSTPRRTPTVSDSGGLKQPYIPAPAPKPSPPSVIVGPMLSPNVPKITPSSSAQRIMARPSSHSTVAKSLPAIASPTPPAIESNSSEATTSPIGLPPPVPLPTKPSVSDDASTHAPMPKPIRETDTPDEKTSSRPIQPTRKKLSLDET
jgi:hypothetical protein